MVREETPKLAAETLRVEHGGKVEIEDRRPRTQRQFKHFLRVCCDSTLRRSIWPPKEALLQDVICSNGFESVISRTRFAGLEIAT